MEGGTHNFKADGVIFYPTELLPGRSWYLAVICKWALQWEAYKPIIINIIVSQAIAHTNFYPYDNFVVLVT